MVIGLSWVRIQPDATITNPLNVACLSPLYENILELDLGSNLEFNRRMLKQNTNPRNGRLSPFYENQRQILPKLCLIGLQLYSVNCFLSSIILFVGMSGHVWAWRETANSFNKDVSVNVNLFGYQSYLSCVLWSSPGLYRDFFVDINSHGYQSYLFWVLIFCVLWRGIRQVLVPGARWEISNGFYSQ